MVSSSPDERNCARSGGASTCEPRRMTAVYGCILTPILRDPANVHRRKKAKPAEEKRAKAEKAVQRSGIGRPGAGIAESGKRHGPYHKNTRHQTRGEKSEQNHEQAADQRHVAKSISKSTNTN